MVHVHGTLSLPTFNWTFLTVHCLQRNPGFNSKGFDTAADSEGFKAAQVATVQQQQT